MLQKRFVVFAAKSSGFIEVRVSHQYTIKSTQKVMKRVCFCKFVVGFSWGSSNKIKCCFENPGCSGFVRHFSRVGSQGQFRCRVERSEILQRKRKAGNFYSPNQSHLKSALPLVVLGEPQTVQAMLIAVDFLHCK